MHEKNELAMLHFLANLVEGQKAIAEAIDRNTAALLGQGQPDAPQAEEDDTGGFTGLDQVEPGRTL